ncbi:hypothetical protein SAMN05443665_1010109 [Actinomadura meyerae]|jgi:hypothetical protein|uniref:Uncharacterized protein n=1 Tax=Actinomadura meyerae TaxID=240840 RepID=A0A239HRB7_9ACTN|nr:hypothetical protein [Actinomadura meyerae]SNS83862.1 hypothetical protein SAMN05443665_1010109 [Actinomadura meyerae]
MNPQKLTYTDLDRLCGEVLPPRLALSSGGDTVIAYACQATYSSGTTGLLGTGLLAQPAYSTLTCVPATVVEHH